MMSRQPPTVFRALGLFVFYHVYLSIRTEIVERWGPIWVPCVVCTSDETHPAHQIHTILTTLLYLYIKSTSSASPFMHRCLSALHHSKSINVCKILFCSLKCFHLFSLCLLKMFVGSPIHTVNIVEMNTLFFWCCEDNRGEKKILQCFFLQQPTNSLLSCSLQVNRSMMIIAESCCPRHL